MPQFFKSIRKSDLYVCVYLRKNHNNQDFWVGQFKGVCSYHDNEKDAAIAVDKMRLKNGKEPINVLIRKL